MRYLWASEVDNVTFLQNAAAKWFDMWCVSCMGRPLQELTVIFFYLLEIRYLWPSEVE